MNKVKQNIEILHFLKVYYEVQLIILLEKKYHMHKKNLFFLISIFYAF